MTALLLQAGRETYVGCGSYSSGDGAFALEILFFLLFFQPSPSLLDVAIFRSSYHHTTQGYVRYRII